MYYIRFSKIFVIRCTFEWESEKRREKIGEKNQLEKKKNYAEYTTKHELSEIERTRIYSNIELFFFWKDFLVERQNIHSIKRNEKRERTPKKRWRRLVSGPLLHLHHNVSFQTTHLAPHLLWSQPLELHEVNLNLWQYFFANASYASIFYIICCLSSPHECSHIFWKGSRRRLKENPKFIPNLTPPKRKKLFWGTPTLSNYPLW